MPSAAAAWIGAALAVGAPSAVVRPVVGAAAGTVVVLAVRSARTGSRNQAAWRAAVALALLVLTLTLVGGSVQRAVRTQGLLGASIRSGATVTVTGTVTDGPTPLTTRWSHGGEDVRYTVAVRWVESRGERSGAAAAVVVVGPGDVPRGATVRVTGRLSSASGGSARTVATVSATSPAQVVRAPAWPEHLADAVRAATRRVAARLPTEPGALLLGMALGDTSRLPDTVSEAMRGAGLTHLVAVSGSHFALVGALVAAAAASCRLSRAGRAAAVLVVGAGLLVLVGPQPSVLRAAVTGTVGIMGLLAGRPARAPAALAVTVVGLLLLDPWLALELGFVLSVLATAAIVLLGPAWVRRWSPFIGRPLAAALAAPLAAQLACAPVLLTVRPTVGTYALLANLAAAPAVPAATVLGLLTALLAPWAPGAALLVAQLAGAACWWVATVAHVAATAPGAALAWAPGSGGVVAMAAVGISVAALLLHGTSRRPWTAGRRRPARRVTTRSPGALDPTA